jgi:hypothetical protein
MRRAFFHSYAMLLRRTMRRPGGGCPTTKV